MAFNILLSGKRWRPKEIPKERPEKISFQFINDITLWAILIFNIIVMEKMEEKDEKEKGDKKGNLKEYSTLDSKKESNAIEEILFFIEVSIDGYTIHQRCDIEFDNKTYYNEETYLKY
ncbi:MAG: hypothetical protein LBR34_05335, partial [Prevotella sp.]|nr:hypothetical protein [Prevotella sp.]